MFEEYIDKKISTYLNLFDSKKEKIHIAEIRTNAGLPRPFKTFIEAEVDWWIYCEGQNRKSHPNFDLQDKEVIKVLSELDSLYKHKAYYTYKSLAELLSSSVKLTLNYLCRSRTTLNWFIFNDSNERNVTYIIKKMMYFYDYKYIYDGFLKYLEDHNISNSEDSIFNSEDFENLLAEIDENYVFGLQPTQFIELTEPIYYFFNIIDEETNELVVPTEALMVFFDDKGLKPIVDLLEEKMTKDTLKLITRDDLLEIIHYVIEETESENEVEEGGISFESNEILEAETVENDLGNNFGEELLVEESDENEIVNSFEDNVEVDEIKDVEFGDEFNFDSELELNEIEATVEGKIEVIQVNETELLSYENELLNNNDSEIEDTNDYGIKNLIEFTDTFDDIEETEIDDYELDLLNARPSMDLSGLLKNKNKLESFESKVEEIYESTELNENETKDLLNSKNALEEFEKETLLGNSNSDEFDFDNMDLYTNDEIKTDLSKDENSVESETPVAQSDENFDFEAYKDYGMSEEELKELLKNG